MHASSWQKMEWFIGEYLGEFRDAPLRILDVGSQIVHESHPNYRSLFDSPAWQYTGLDISSGLNVDVVVSDPYAWNEVEADTFDVVVSGQALEHVSWFWLTAVEIARALRPGGITMLIAPSSGPEHRYPLDCWRFYPDGMEALAAFAGCRVLDAGTDWATGPWRDSYLVMQKPHDDPAWRVEFDRRREALHAAVATSGGGHSAPATAMPPASPMLVSSGRRVSARMDAASAERMPAASGPPQVVAPQASPPADGANVAWRRIIRRIAGQRLLAVYRAARYGTSHP